MLRKAADYFIDFIYSCMRCLHMPGNMSAADLWARHHTGPALWKWPLGGGRTRQSRHGGRGTL